nr:MAG TPA: Tail tape measure [Caudoviricetes sp.]
MRIFSERRKSMATIKQMFELVDGVSPVINKLVRSVDKVAGKFDRTAKAASGMETAAERGANGIRTAAAQAASPIQTLGGLVLALNQRLRNVGDEAFSKIKAGVSGMVGQFALATIAANAFMSALSYISGIPDRLVRASDAYAGIQARLRLVAGGAQQAAELNDLIYASAQRARGSYEEMADSVSKIAMTARKAFPDAREVVPFMEGIQKLFVIGGTGVEQQKNALLQLTQALGSGRLQGDEFRSIAEAAPLIEQMVAKYMQIDPGKLKAISSEGKITADILRNSILTNLDMINAQFETMPRTWEQNMQVIRNAGQRAFAPVFVAINDLANSEAGQAFANAIAWGLYIAAQAILGVINNVKWLGGIIKDNRALIEPILMGLGIAFLALGISAASSGAMAAVGALAHAAASAIETAQLLALIVAQEGLNAALYACPLTWIIGLIVALVAVFYLAIAAVNYFAGTSISATGIIFAAFAGMFTSIVNHLKFVANVFIAFANFLGSVFQDPLGAIYNLFVDIWNGVSEYVGQAVNGIIDMINAIPGMDKIRTFDHVETPTFQRKEIANATFHINPFEYGNAVYNAQQAYEYGANMKFPGMPDGLVPDTTPYTAVSSTDPEDIGKSGKRTADNTGAIKDAMELSEEDLKYLREAAEQEAINRYTTATVQIDMGGINNNISSDVDVDGMMTYMNDSLIQAMVAGAEGVHPT